MNDERAVSEVIGLLLLVATVVILSAFIAAVVFGMIGAVIPGKTVALTVVPGNTSSNHPSAIVTLHGGPDIDRMTFLQYSLTDGSAWGNVTDINGNELSVSDYPLAVGEVVTIGSHDPAGKRIMLRATFSDGTMQVLFDEQF